MVILDYSGCPPPAEGPSCFGPTQQWWLFNVPLKSYPNMILVSLIISIIIFSILYITNKKAKTITLKKNLIISGIIFVLILFLEIISLSWAHLNIVY